MDFKKFKKHGITKINESKLNISINEFLNNDIILIKSGTGTGKTKNIGKICKELKEKTGCRVLSVVNLINLSREQIKTFNEESNTILFDYQKDLAKFDENDGVICLNSLYKLNDIENYDMNNIVLYIDEVNDLIRSITHNDALDKVLNKVYTTLINLIKNCKKIICSDATIDDNTLNLLSSRKHNKKLLLIENSNKKFKGVKAIRHNDESKFIDELRNHIKNKNYFLFGADLCTTITDIHNLLLNEFPEQEEDFILITSETSFRPTNANIQFQNKYVFYSPSITTGVSFVFEGAKQDQFIYVSNKTLITPISLYQMSSRTRNMKNLIYYSKQIKSIQPRFQNLKECEKYYKNLINASNKILNMSKSTTEDDETVIIENSFFKMHCYNEYQMDLFKYNFEESYKNILVDNGFDYEEIGTYNTITNEEKKQLIETRELINDNEFNEYINSAFIELETDENLEEVEKTNRKHKILSTRASLLNICKKEDAEKYKIFITDEYSLLSYYNFLSLFRTDEYIKTKATEKANASFKIRTIANVYTKVQLLKLFESHYKIKRFDLEFEIKDIPEINDDFKTLYSNIFPKRTKKTYTTSKALRQIYINLIRNICGDLPIITQKNIKVNGKNDYKYTLNKTLIEELITLCKINNCGLKNYNTKLVEIITGIKPDIEPSNYHYCDEEEIKVDYMFGKTNFKN
jgi:hypothetical protein